MSTSAFTTRRDFLKGSAAATGTLVIGFTLPVSSRFAQAAAAAMRRPGHRLCTERVPAHRRGWAGHGHLRPVRDGPGRAHGHCLAGRRGTRRRLEERQLEQAPVDKAYNNPLFGMQATGGSTAIRGHYEPMRMAGAAAREMLVAAAAGQWGVDAAACRTQDGRVMGPDGKSAGYGELVAAASKLPVPQNPSLKDPKDFRILGKGLTRIDTPAKVNGSAGFRHRRQGAGTAHGGHGARAGARREDRVGRRCGCEGDPGREAGRADSAGRRRAGRGLLDRAEGPRRTGREMGRRPARFVVVRRHLESS